MHGKISLPVTVEVEGSQHDTAGHWLCENPRGYWIAVAHNDPGQTNIDRDELHVRLRTDILSGPNPSA